jgi:uncharacterized cupredoxin-like copper-binding protein
MYVFSLLLAAAVSGAGPTPKPARATASVVTVHARDFSYVAPKTVKSGINTFRLVNDGKEMHHLSIIKLDKGKTMTDLAAVMKNPGPPPTWIKNVGGPNAAVPGATVEATLALDPGAYVMMCFIPSPGDAMPHAMKGMMAGFTVTAEASGGADLATDATVHLTDYSFTLDKPLAAGHRVLKVVNDAQQPHELVMVQLAPGKTIADLGNWVDKDMMKGPPPGRPVGGMSGMDNGRSGSFPVDLKPGKYGLICFVPDAKDGKSHFAHGMSKEILVAAK